MSAPRPLSVETEARDLLLEVLDMAMDCPHLCTGFDCIHAARHLAAALTAHATAAVAAAERTAWKAGADEALRLARKFCQCGNAVKVQAPAAPPAAGEETMT